MSMGKSIPSVQMSARVGGKKEKSIPPFREVRNIRPRAFWKGVEATSSVEQSVVFLVVLKIMLYYCSWELRA